MSQIKKEFCVDNYDCIGFDLDHTLVNYNDSELMNLVYEVLVSFLMNKKGYNGKYLLQPFRPEFLQKGLFLDLERGNIVKLNRTGCVLQAYHGTKTMSDDDIIELYGADKVWQDGHEYTKDILNAWNSALEKRIRAVLDPFDEPVALIFARAVDTIDEEAGKIVGEYNLWPDLLEGLYAMYIKGNFANNTGGFFPAVKQNPEKYYKKCSQKQINWLRDMKKQKFTFLLTGSFVDFATLTATTGVGEFWQELFDVIICFGRKPMFFFKDHPFLKLYNNAEGEPVPAGDIASESVYSQGNWKELVQLIANKTNTVEPKILYIGDNLIQDIYSPSKFNCCDTIAVVKELKEPNSEVWGSFFKGCDDGNGNDSTTFWKYIIDTYAATSISNLDDLCDGPSPPATQSEN